MLLLLDTYRHFQFHKYILTDACVSLEIHRYHNRHRWLRESFTPCLPNTYLNVHHRFTDSLRLEETSETIRGPRSRHSPLGRLQGGTGTPWAWMRPEPSWVYGDTSWVYGDVCRAGAPTCRWLSRPSHMLASTNLHVRN